MQCLLELEALIKKLCLWEMKWPPLAGRWHIFLLFISSACFSGLSFVWHITNSIPSLSCIRASEVKRKSNDHLHLSSMSLVLSSFLFFKSNHATMIKWVVVGSSEKWNARFTYIQMFIYFNFMISQRQSWFVILQGSKKRW
jgi:hypothetical protein